VEQELFFLPEYMNSSLVFTLFLNILPLYGIYILYLLRLRYSERVSSSCSTSGIRRDGDSGILEG
jgi:hypothetical protein